MNRLDENLKKKLELDLKYRLYFKNRVSRWARSDVYVILTFLLISEARGVYIKKHHSIVCVIVYGIDRATYWIPLPAL